MAKVVTYRHLTDDVVAAPDQETEIPDNYRWEPSWRFRIKANLVCAGSWLFAQRVLPQRLTCSQSQGLSPGCRARLFCLW